MGDSCRSSTHVLSPVIGCKSQAFLERDQTPHAPSWRCWGSALLPHPEVQAPSGEKSRSGWEKEMDPGKRRSSCGHTRGPSSNALPAGARPLDPASRAACPPRSPRRSARSPRTPHAPHPPGSSHPFTRSAAGPDITPARYRPPARAWPRPLYQLTNSREGRAGPTHKHTDDWSHRPSVFHSRLALHIPGGARLKAASGRRGSQKCCFSCHGPGQGNPSSSGGRMGRVLFATFFGMFTVVQRSSLPLFQDKHSWSLESWTRTNPACFKSCEQKQRPSLLSHPFSILWLSCRNREFINLHKLQGGVLCLSETQLQSCL